ncbi:hypothetical protein QBC40DRAFT_310454 [Triangularia verruculosa]|uniref:Uncharacterized protein n=1 Tax=Triangularia verruculosa TaxID=2587418 RepID=A0AAN6XDF1_9PEZI|nr:hypothetical protein QBC40DRAFT_310454 [Triangularia verruculosa]
MWWSIFISLAATLAFFEVPTQASLRANPRSRRPNSTLSYGIVPVSWDIPIKADDLTSDTITVTGTIQEAITQMEAAYPGWNATFQAGLPAAPGNISDISFSTAGDPEIDHYNCDNDSKWKKASANQIWVGVTYLWKLTGTAKNGPGPGNCGRVSCSWGAAIYWCNDDDEEKELQWKWIGDGANYLLDGRCLSEQGRRVKGQTFYKNKWNVIVRRDDC